MTDHREAIAEWFHRELGVERCDRHGGNVKPACENWAAALLASPALADLLATERQRGREEALREAAREAEERGDIGKDGGIEAWTWLRIRADRIGGVSAAADRERGGS